jgi:NMD protein affecting ribosome stability and mRNA decay
MTRSYYPCKKCGRHTNGSGHPRVTLELCYHCYIVELKNKLNSNNKTTELNYKVVKQH